MQNHVQPEQSSRVRSVLNIARYKKTVYSVAWIQFAMLACYGPYIVMAFVLNFGNVVYSTEIEIADRFFFCVFFCVFKFISESSPLLLKDQRFQTGSEKHHSEVSLLLS